MDFRVFPIDLINQLILWGYTALQKLKVRELSCSTSVVRIRLWCFVLDGFIAQ